MEKKNILKAGAGCSEIKLPEDLFPTEGFIGVHDPLHARVLLLCQGESAALVSVEMTSMADEECDALREIVADMAGISGEQVWVFVTHTFSAPHIPPAFLKLDPEMEESRAKVSGALREAVRAAARQAISRMTEVRLGVGTGSCKVNVNRDITTVQGVWLGLNPAGPSNREVTVLRLENSAGDPVAVLFHYGVQSSVMDHCELSSGGQMVTSDLVGKAALTVEEAFGPDCVALFLPGPCGDQAPSAKGKYFAVDENGAMVEQDIHEEGFSLIERLGIRLGAAVIQTAEQIVCLSENAEISHGYRAQTCSGKFHDRDANKHGPRKEYVYEPAEEEPLEIRLMRIGGIALVGVKPELNCVTGMQLQQASPCAVTLPVQMVNGGQKYMPDRDSYTRITYEAINSGFACGSAEQFVEWSVELLAESEADA